MSNKRSGKSSATTSDQAAELAKLADRIDELEARTAFQDDLLSALNDVVASQDNRIAALDRQLDALRQQLSAQTPQGGGHSNSAHEPPPHY